MASLEVDRVLRREKGKDATLGVEIVPISRRLGIANLSYGQISTVFEFLDAKTILKLYRACGKSDKNQKENDSTYQAILKAEFVTQGKDYLPKYLKIPLFFAIARNLENFAKKLE